MTLRNDLPLMTQEQTWAAVACLKLAGLAELSEDGESFALTDAGFEKAWRLLESLSDEDKVLLFSLKAMFEFAKEDTGA